MKKIIVIFFQGGQNFKIKQLFLEIKKKFKAEAVESRSLQEGSLFDDENYQDKNRLCCLLEKNSKQKHPNYFIVLAFGEKITDKRIWEVVKEYPKTATMIYPDKKGLVKVTEIKENYFEGTKVVFSKEETEKIFEQMNSEICLEQRKLDYESFRAQQWAEKTVLD